MAEEVGNLVARVSVDDTGVNKTFSELSRNVKLAQSEFNKASVEVEAFGKGTDGLRVKADALTKQINAQQQLVNKLRAEHEKSAKEKGEDAKQTQNYEIRLNKAVTELAKLQNQLQTTNTELEKQTTAWAKIGEALDGFSNKMETVGKRMSDVGKDMSIAFTVPIMAIGAVAYSAADDVDKAMAEIRASTGATGETLKELGNVLESVTNKVPSDIKEVAVVVADLNKLIGLTGEALDDATKRVMDYARVNKVDASEAAKTLSRLLNGLGKDVSELPGLMDMLTKASQLSGIGVNELSEIVIGAGPAFEELGYGLEKSIALFSSFYKAGANPAEVVSSLNKVMVQLSKEGFTDAEQAFSELLKRIREAPTLLEGVTLAVEAFGARAGANIADDIRAGRFEVDEWVEAMRNSHGVLEQTADDTLTLGDRFKMLRNQAEGSVAPIGHSLVDALESVLDASQPLVEAIGGIAEGFAALDPQTQQSIIKFVALAAAIGPLLIVAGKLVTSIGAVTTAIRALGSAMVFLATNPVGLALTAIAVSVGAVTSAMSSAKRATDELRMAQEELQRVQQKGIERHEIESFQEKIVELQELKAGYDEAKQAAEEFERTLAEGTAAYQRGEIDMLAFSELQSEYANLISIVEGWKQTLEGAGHSVEFLEEQIKEYTQAIENARRATIQDINESAQRVAVQNGEVKSIEKLLKTYRSAKKDSDEWKDAQSQLAQMFPQFTDEVGINADAIDGLLDIKRQEIELSWQSVQVKAMELKTFKEANAARIEGEMELLKLDSWAIGMYRQKADELALIRSEITALEGIVGNGPPEIVSFKPTSISSVGGNADKEGAYKNVALENAYRQLEHKKKLDQLSLESEMATLEQIKSKYIKTADERMVMEEKLYAVRKRIAEQSKDLETELLDEATRLYKTSVEDKIIREELTAQQRFEIQKKMHDNIIQDNEAYLKRVLADDRYTAEEKERIQKQVTETIRVNINERLQLEKGYYEEIQRQQIDNINNLSKGVQSALQAKYQAELRAGEESIKAQMEVNSKWRNDTIENVKSVYDYRIKAAQQAADAEIARINSVLGAQIEAIQTELAALDAAEKQKSRAELDEDDQKKIDRLSSMIDYEHDDFNKAQLQKELNKVLADQAKRHEKEQLDDKKEALREEERTLREKLKEEVDLVKQNLAEQREMLNNERDAEIARINFIAEYQKMALETELMKHQDHYAELLKAKNIQAEAEKMIVQNQQKEIISLLESFGDAYNITGQSLGEQMYEGFKGQVMQITSLIDQINARINAARAAALSVMAMGFGGGGGVPAPAPVTNNYNLQNNFNTPVTSPSDVSRATTKTAQQLML